MRQEEVGGGGGGWGGGGVPSLDPRRSDPSPSPVAASPCLPADRWPGPLAGGVSNTRANEVNSVSTTVSR